MARRVKKVKPAKTDPGILYVILVELEGKQLVKIGVTHRRIEDRVPEILVAVFKKYRYFPYCNPRRFTKTASPYKKEKILHKQFAEHSYTTSKKFGGSTEFFDINLDDVTAAYDSLVDKVKAVKPKKPVVKKGVFFSVDKSI